jgi:hypothetical protein
MGFLCVRQFHYTALLGAAQHDAEQLGWQTTGAAVAAGHAAGKPAHDWYAPNCAPPPPPPLVPSPPAHTLNPTRIINVYSRDMPCVLLRVCLHGCAFVTTGKN